MDNNIRPSANIGLPLNLINKQESWPAYVTYVSPVVNKLIEQDKLKHIQNPKPSRENSWDSNFSDQSLLNLPKRANFSAEATYSENPTTSVPALGSLSSLSFSPPVLHVNNAFPQMVFRDGPTEAYNRIIFSQKPMLRILVYDDPLENKERKTNVH
ncbi:CMT1A duplicated region transcript 4 protein [Macrotis lagotis]|uniref:CMT1A duplicated region transcript 4 protein n=1 Tax=Macrotis lagotis TaxID=92651 RepID=UPI003D691CFB